MHSTVSQSAEECSAAICEQGKPCQQQQQLLCLVQEKAAVSECAASLKVQCCQGGQRGAEMAWPVPLFGTTRGYRGWAGT